MNSLNTIDPRTATPDVWPEAAAHPLRTADLRRMEQQGSAAMLLFTSLDADTAGSRLLQAGKLAQNFAICFAFVAASLLLWSYVW